MHRFFDKKKYEETTIYLVDCAKDRAELNGKFLLHQRQHSARAVACMSTNYLFVVVGCHKNVEASTVYKLKGGSKF